MVDAGTYKYLVNNPADNDDDFTIAGADSQFNHNYPDGVRGVSILMKMRCNH